MIIAGKTEEFLAVNYGLKPRKSDRGGYLYSDYDVALSTIPHIDRILRKQEKRMSDKIKKAESQVTDAENRYIISYKKMDKAYSGLENKVQESSRVVRKACNDISGAISKLERTANIDRLERLANTLERAANAITTLSELDQEGKLERIAMVLK